MNGSKRFYDVSKFYGGTGKPRSTSKFKQRFLKKLQLIEESSHKMKDDFIVRPYTRLSEGPDCWKVFPKQQMALDYSHAQCENSHVFALELDSPDSEGQRNYLVTTYFHLWHQYKQLSSSKRHAYEVIPEGSVCRLYFDLEFNKVLNPNANGLDLLEIFIKYVNLKLFQKYGIVCTRKNILDLDASSNTKFSRHLIYHMPNAAFANNVEAGYFVLYVCSELKKDINDNIVSDTVMEISSDASAKDQYFHIIQDCYIDKEDLKKLFIVTKDNQSKLFCDTAVYTKNRNFRLYLSSKVGQLRPLVVSAQNEFQSIVPPKCKRKHEDQVFFDSLIANISFQEDMRILSCETINCKNNISTSMVGASDNNKGENQLLDGYQQSPFPEVDNFVTKLVSNCDVPGYFRRWVYYCEGMVLSYDIAKNRYCENIRRQHKSNNIIILVDLKRSVYYQKCHDPDCRFQNFKSQEWSLPPDLLPWSNFDTEVFDEMEPSENNIVFDGDLKDEDFLKAALAMEQSEEYQHFFEEKPS